MKAMIPINKMIGFVEPFGMHHCANRTIPDAVLRVIAHGVGNGRQGVGGCPARQARLNSLTAQAGGSMGVHRSSPLIEYHACSSA